MQYSQQLHLVIRNSKEVSWPLRGEQGSKVKGRESGEEPMKRGLNLESGRQAREETQNKAKLYEHHPRSWEL
jgi:hypothetical protein